MKSMTLLAGFILLGSMIVAVSGCKPSHTASINSTEDSSDLLDLTPTEDVETDKNVVFNFADFAANNRALSSTIGPLASKDRSYIEIGEPSKFGIQTNSKLESSLNKAFGRRTSLDGSFWVDGFAFGKKIGGDGVGTLVDMGIQAEEREMELKGHLRFLGKERLAGALKTAIEQLLTRSLGGDSIVYGSPFLGLKVGGNIGGQIGLKADLDRNLDDAIVLAFTPKSGLNGGLTTKVESLSFVRTEVAGLVNILDSSLVNQGTFGALRQLGLMIGDVGMDSGTFSALDGSIVIGASVGPNGLLPDSVDQKLWTKITEKSAEFLKKWGVWLPDLSWSHVVWDPKPVHVKDLPEFSKPFLSFFNKPLDRANCDEKHKELETYVNKVSGNIERLAAKVDASYQQSKDENLKNRLRVLSNVKTNYQVILARCQEYCNNLRE